MAHYYNVFVQTGIVPGMRQFTPRTFAAGEYEFANPVQTKDTVTIEYKDLIFTGIAEVVHTARNSRNLSSSRIIMRDTSRREEDLEKIF